MFYSVWYSTMICPVTICCMLTIPSGNTLERNIHIITNRIIYNLETLMITGQQHKHIWPCCRNICACTGLYYYTPLELCTLAFDVSLVDQACQPLSSRNRELHFEKYSANFVHSNPSKMAENTISMKRHNTFYFQFKNR